MYVMIQPFEIGLNKPYKAARPIKTAKAIRVTTLNLALKPCIVTINPSLLEQLSSHIFPSTPRIPFLPKKKKKASNQALSEEISN